MSPRRQVIYIRADQLPLTFASSPQLAGASIHPQPPKHKRHHSAPTSASGSSPGGANGGKHSFISICSFGGEISA